jgi:hypothetical protein
VTDLILATPLLDENMVLEIKYSVGGCISMLRRSWASYKIARREGYADRCLELEYWINFIQAVLVIEECSFG